MMKKNNILGSTLKQPEIIGQYDNNDWNLLLQQARASDLQARLFQIFETYSLVNVLPEKIKKHLSNDIILVKYLSVQVTEEIRILGEHLQKHQIQPIYLKGAAYILAGFSLSKNRKFSDIDLLFSKHDISKVEKSLKIKGFISQKTDDYDQQYYREYMHEIPPLQHVVRGTVLDVHHNILPVCKGVPVNIELLSELAIDVDFQGQTVKTLSAEGIFIHCAVHLFHEGEFEKGLRDLTDLAMLYRELSEQNIEFSGQLIKLATKLKLEKNAYLALYYIERLLNVQLDDDAQAFVTQFRKQLNWSKLNDFIFTNVLVPHHSSVHCWQFSLAKFLAYWRSHLLKMPITLLIPHLFKKSIKQLSGKFEKTEPTKTTPNL